MIFGIGTFSYYLGDLSSQFAKFFEISNGLNERLFRIEQLGMQFGLDNELINKIKFEITKADDIVDLEINKNFEMQHLMTILPSTLSNRLGKFVFKGAIS